MKFLANSSYFFPPFLFSSFEAGNCGVLGLGRKLGKCRREADFPALDERPPLKEFDCLSNTAKCFDIFHTLDNQLRGNTLEGAGGKMRGRGYMPRWEHFK